MEASSRWYFDMAGDAELLQVINTLAFSRLLLSSEFGAESVTQLR